MDGDIRTSLRLLVANRRSPEARALFLQLAAYAEKRVNSVGRSRYPDVLSGAEREEVTADVMMQLMSGALAAFRGDTLPALLAYVRQICDRSLYKAAQRRLRERATLDGQGGEHVRDWSGTLPGPDEAVRAVPEPELPAKDRDYLLAVLRSGSRADYARDHDVSRAAVTQRINRIKQRISELDLEQQRLTEAWLRHQAAQLE